MKKFVNAFFEGAQRWKKMRGKRFILHNVSGVDVVLNKVRVISHSNNIFRKITLRTDFIQHDKKNYY